MGAKITVWTPARIKKECKQLDEWSKTEDALTMLSYCADYDLVQQTLLDAVSKYPRLSESYKKAKARVGARRERLAMKGEINAGLVQRSLRLYNCEQDIQDNKEAYDKAYQSAKAQLDATGIDKDEVGDIVKYIKSQKDS